MTQDEAKRQMQVARSRVTQLRGELQAAEKAERETCARVGLVTLGLNVGDIIVSRGHRYIVTGARFRYLRVVPVAVLIKKDGTTGAREMPSYSTYVVERATT